MFKVYYGRKYELFGTDRPGTSLIDHGSHPSPSSHSSSPCNTRCQVGVGNTILWRCFTWNIKILVDRKFNVGTTYSRLFCILIIKGIRLSSCQRPIPDPEIFFPRKSFFFFYLLRNKVSVSLPSTGGRLVIIRLRCSFTFTFSNRTLL